MTNYFDKSSTNWNTVFLINIYYDVVYVDENI